MHLTFYDSQDSWQSMLPLTYTRPVAEIRIGILKIHEKWARHLGAETVRFRTQSYLQGLFPSPEAKSLTLLGGVLPSRDLLTKLTALDESAVLTYEGKVVAGYYEPTEEFNSDNREEIELESLDRIQYPWDVFKMNGQEIRKDFSLVTDGRQSQELADAHTAVYGTDVFLEEGAKVRSAVLNAENGPIYIGKGAEINEGALIKGPFVLGDYSAVSMGAKMRGDNTIGPYSKAGGEVSNAVIFGYSNKGHDGFLGNSVIGEWCNLGADTNNSNLKNNYANVKMWDYAARRFSDTGLQFCGLVMGDHSKCGINTMFNTGTSVGVSANIFGEGFPRTIIPSFAWGGSSGFSTYQTRKAFETAELVVQRRGKSLTEADKQVLSHIFEMTSEYRVWEKK